MTEPSPTATELLRLKDEIVERWRQLPVEHQATMALVLLREVFKDEKYDAWLAE